MANQSRKRLRELLFSEHPSSPRANPAKSLVRLRVTVVDADGEHWCGVLGLPTRSQFFTVQCLLDELARLSPDLRFWPEVRCFLVCCYGRKFPLFRNHLLLDSIRSLREITGAGQHEDVNVHVYQDYERYMGVGSAASKASSSVANVTPGPSRASANVAPRPSTGTINMAAIYAALIGRGRSSSTAAHMEPGPSRATAHMTPGPSRTMVNMAAGPSGTMAHAEPGPSGTMTNMAPGPSRTMANMAGMSSDDDDD